MYNLGHIGKRFYIQNRNNDLQNFYFGKKNFIFLYITYNKKETFS
jgi:hypothetical protein